MMSSPGRGYTLPIELHICVLGKDGQATTLHYRIISCAPNNALPYKLCAMRVLFRIRFGFHSVIMISTPMCIFS